MFCPSIHPSSRSPGEISIVGVGPEESERKPIRAVLGRCCASTASGTTMRPPVKVPRNIRRSNPIPLAGPCRIEGTGRDGQWGESIPAGVKRATASCPPWRGAVLRHGKPVGLRSTTASSWPRASFGEQSATPTYIYARHERRRRRALYILLETLGALVWLLSGFLGVVAFSSAAREG